MRKIPCIFFHNVLERRVAGDVYHDKQLTADELAAALEFVKSRYQPLTIEQFLDLSQDRCPVKLDKPPIFISFDDGHRGTFALGAKVLAELKVPALVFVLGRVLTDANFVPPYMEFVHLVRSAGDTRATFRGRELCLRTPADYERVRSQWIRMRRDTYEPFLQELAGAFDLSRPTRADLPPDLAYVTPDELRRHAGHEYLRVGSHAMSHLPLGWLPPKDQAAELRQSYEVLSGLLDDYVPVVSYPDGSHDASTRQAAAGVYQFGFAVQSGADWRDPFAYPRQCISTGDIRDVRYHFSRRRKWIVLPLKKLLASPFGRGWS
jgi:peptidoglycan/xylan/chitin deacetylase (PgdA/CDA1 family)